MHTHTDVPFWWRFETPTFAPRFRDNCSNAMVEVLGRFHSRKPVSFLVFVRGLVQDHVL